MPEPTPEQVAEAEALSRRAVDSGKPDQWMALYIAALEETADKEEAAELADELVDDMEGNEE